MKSFLHGKKSLPSAGNPPARATIALGGVAHAPASAGGANVEVVKEGEKVVRLVITCACGERTEVECLYKPGV